MFPAGKDRSERRSAARVPAAPGKIDRYCAGRVAAYNPAEINQGSRATVNSSLNSLSCRPADECFALRAPMS